MCQLLFSLVWVLIIYSINCYIWYNDFSNRYSQAGLLLWRFNYKPPFLSSDILMNILFYLIINKTIAKVNYSPKIIQQNLIKRIIRKAIKSELIITLQILENTTSNVEDFLVTFLCCLLFDGNFSSIFVSCVFFSKSSIVYDMLFAFWITLFNFFNHIKMKFSCFICMICLRFMIFYFYKIIIFVFNKIWNFVNNFFRCFT